MKTREHRPTASRIPVPECAPGLLAGRCRRLAAEAHGGTLELRETAELPTLFVFRLPLRRKVRNP